jgi:uncharacterized protein
VPEHGRGFAAIQRSLAAFVRDPRHSPPPDGVGLERLEVYRELCFHNVESFMANCYPLTRAVLGGTRWQALVEDYFREHRATTVSFPRMPQEFLRWLDRHGQPAATPPFLRELAEYEWLELEVSFDEQELDAVAIDEGIDCLAGVPVLNPTARLRTYRWPVHRLGPDPAPTEPAAAPTHLAILRTRADEVTFMTLTPATARLVNLIAANADRSGSALVADIASELGAAPATLLDAGAAMLDELRAGELLLGARRLRSPPV